MLAVVGFFVIPVVGFFIGFPLGVYLEERRRLGRHASAWRSTREALRAMGLSIVIELSATVARFRCLAGGGAELSSRRLDEPEPGVQVERCAVAGVGEQASRRTVMSPEPMASMLPPQVRPETTKRPIVSGASGWAILGSNQ